jgi:DNA (cytosine-5)-methyltransferase 1
MPTLNAMDNNGEAFATALILMEEGKPVIMRNREGCAGGGKGLMYSDKSFTLATSNDQFLYLAVDVYNASIDGEVTHTLKAANQPMGVPSVLIIDGTRVDDVRVYEDGIVPTVISRYGTGGGNVPMVFPIQGTVIGRADTSGPQGKGYAEDETMFTLTKTDIHAVSSNATVRRLTPTECERLQGFPDNWTDGQADSNRYKQMGNAVAVPVVQWIIDRMVAE